MTFALKNRWTKQIFPRFHQLTLVTALLSDIQEKAGIPSRLS
jgi:hypothetical protein